MRPPGFRVDSRQTAPYSPELEPDIVLIELQPRHSTPSARMIFCTLGGRQMRLQRVDNLARARVNLTAADDVSAPARLACGDAAPARLRKRVID
jgi:hypothetical protein